MNICALLVVMAVLSDALPRRGSVNIRSDQFDEADLEENAEDLIEYAWQKSSGPNQSNKMFSSIERIQFQGNLRGRTVETVPDSSFYRDEEALILDARHQRVVDPAAVVEIVVDSLDEVEHQDAVENVVSREDAVENVVSREDAVENVVSREDAVENVVEREDAVENVVQLLENVGDLEDAVENVVELEDAVENVVELEDAVENVVELEDAVENVVELEDAVENVVEHEDAVAMQSTDEILAAETNSSLVNNSAECELYRNEFKTNRSLTCQVYHQTNVFVNFDEALHLSSPNLSNETGPYCGFRIRTHANYTVNINCPYLDFTASGHLLVIDVNVPSAVRYTTVKVLGNSTIEGSGISIIFYSHIETGKEGFNCIANAVGKVSNYTFEERSRVSGELFSVMTMVPCKNNFCGYTAYSPTEYNGTMETVSATRTTGYKTAGDEGTPFTSTNRYFRSTYGVATTVFTTEEGFLNRNEGINSFRKPTIISSKVTTSTEINETASSTDRDEYKIYLKNGFVGKGPSVSYVNKLNRWTVSDSSARTIKSGTTDRKNSTTKKSNTNLKIHTSFQSEQLLESSESEVNEDQSTRTPPL